MRTLAGVQTIRELCLVHVQVQDRLQGHAGAALVHDEYACHVRLQKEVGGPGTCMHSSESGVQKAQETWYPLSEQPTCPLASNPAFMAAHPLALAHPQ